MAAGLKNPLSTWRGSWTVFSFVTAGTAIVAGVAAWKAEQYRVENSKSAYAMVQPRTPGLGDPSIESRLMAEATDFSVRLPRTSNDESVMADLQRAAGRSGVEIAEVQIRSQTATRESLGRTEMTLLLHGSYPGAKQLVSEALSRFPNLGLVRLAATAQDGGKKVQFSLTLTIWTRQTPDLVPRTGIR